MNLNIGNDTFLYEKVIGQGSYGKVYKIKFEEKDYAIKVIQNKKNDGIISLRELDIMGRLRHKNLSKSYKIISGIQGDIIKYGIIMDLAEMDLYNAMLNKRWTTNCRLRSLYQLSDGLSYLHSNNYIHLDIKPSNVLLYNNKKITKLTDFGLSLLMVKGKIEYPKALISIDHRPPEILKDKYIYKTSTDIWSLGITFLEVLSGGQSIFYDFDDKDFDDKDKVLKRITETLSSKKIDETLKDYLCKIKNPLKTEIIKLLKKMLMFAPSKRPNIKQILNNKIFKSFKNNVGLNINTPTLDIKYCNIANYYAFDKLIRIATNLPISTETFFLATDMYNRALPYAEAYTNLEESFKNLTYIAMTCLYMAVKILEPFKLTPQKLVQLTQNKFFTANSIIRGESLLTSQWKGIMYPKNLFNISTTFRRLEFAFNLNRRCKVYRRIDLDKWTKLDKKEVKTEGVYDKNVPFNIFFPQTQYYKSLVNDENYIQKIYDKDNK